jgi:hypothetical protein
LLLVLWGVELAYKRSQKRNLMKERLRQLKDGHI